MCEHTPDAQIELAPTLEAPSRARAFVRDALCARHAAPVGDDAALLVSELVTNGVLHGKTGVSVALDCDTHEVRIAVSDGGAGQPVVRTTGAGEVGGWGMHLVNELATRWGVERLPAGGKRVWFVLSPDGPH